MKGITTKHKLLTGTLGGLAALLLLASMSLAAGETLPRSLVSGGGGQMGAEGLALHSAIGQPAVGSVGDGPILCSGFWCGPGAPASSGGGKELFFLYLPLTQR